MHNNTPRIDDAVNDPVFRVILALDFKLVKIFTENVRAQAKVATGYVEYLSTQDFNCFSTPFDRDEDNKKLEMFFRCNCKQTAHFFREAERHTESIHNLEKLKTIANPFQRMLRIISVKYHQIKNFPRLNSSFLILLSGHGRNLPACQFLLPTKEC